MEHPESEGVTEARMYPSEPEGLEVRNNTTRERRFYAWDDPAADQYMSDLVKSGEGYHITPLLYDPTDPPSREEE